MGIGSNKYEVEGLDGDVLLVCDDFVTIYKNNLKKQYMMEIAICSISATLLNLNFLNENMIGYIKFFFPGNKGNCVDTFRFHKKQCALMYSVRDHIQRQIKKYNKTNLSIFEREYYDGQ